jgi:hypothetical protein
MEIGIYSWEVEASGRFNGLFIWSLKICDNFWILKTLILSTLKVLNSFVFKPGVIDVQRISVMLL